MMAATLPGESKAGRAALLGLLLAVGGAAQAADDWRVFETCMGCHSRSADQPMPGPAFSAIRERYRDTPDAVAQLAERIAKGSSGRWGAVAMPANSALSPEQARAAALWILGSKPANPASAP
jgi:cytochrome c